MNRFTLRRLTWLDARAGQLERAGHFDEAAVLREQHCRELEEQLGTDHLAYLEGLHRLAKSYCQAGRPADGEEAYRRAVALIEPAVRQTPNGGSELEALEAQLLNDLGVLLCSQQRPLEALVPLGRAVELATHILPFASPSRARVHYNLAGALHSLGRFERAREAYEQTLEVLRVLPPSPDRVDCLADLAECLLELDDAASIETLEASLAQARAHLTDPGCLAQQFLRLASLAERAQRRSWAIDLLEEAVEVVAHLPEHANLHAHCLGVLSMLQETRLGR